MAISKLKQIKQIVKDHPVTDPRGALLAIEMTLAQKNPERKVRPNFRVDVYETDTGFEVKLFGTEDVTPCQVRAAQQAIKDFIAKKIAEEDAEREPKEELDPEHKASIERTATKLAALFHKFRDAEREPKEELDPERKASIERTATKLAALFHKFSEAQKQQPKVSDTDSNSTQGAN